MSSPEVFWQIGLILIKSNIQSSKNVALRRFRSFFGVSPRVCFKCWELLKNSNASNCKPKHLMWALLLLKCYNTEAVNHSITKVDEKTFRYWAWTVITLISNLDIINWDDRLDQATDGQYAFVSIDGTDFRICEPTPFDPKFFSHKFRGPGLRYEIALNIKNGTVVWANGGVPCGEFSDLKLARDLFIKNLQSGEKVVADKGYPDTNYFIQPNIFNKNLHKKIMCRHETLNNRLKKFNVLGNRFRHNLRKHPICFYAVINLVHLSIKDGEKLYDVL